MQTCKHKSLYTDRDHVKVSFFKNLFFLCISTESTSIQETTFSITLPKLVLEGKSVT